MVRRRKIEVESMFVAPRLGNDLLIGAHFRSSHGYESLNELGSREQHYDFPPHTSLQSRLVGTFYPSDDTGSLEVQGRDIILWARNHTGTRSSCELLNTLQN